MKFYDPNDDLLITQRGLPHWAQDDRVVFITWRMQDSLPVDLLDTWRSQRSAWLRGRGLDPENPDWKSQLQELPASEVAEFHARFTEEWHRLLDQGHGSCALRDPACAAMVRDSLLHFEGDRYQMHGFVIMPNHVHLLVSFPDRQTLLEQCESWKRFTSTRLNRLLNRTGRFWQKDAFDHLVRGPVQYHRLVQYLADNPIHARLQPGEYLLYLKADEAGGKQSRPYSPSEVPQSSPHSPSGVPRSEQGSEVTFEP